MRGSSRVLREPGGEIPPGHSPRRGRARHPRDAQTLREDIADVLAPLGLRLSPAKTQTVHMSESFGFLGFRIQWRRKRGTGKWYVYTFIADRPSGR